MTLLDYISKVTSTFNDKRIVKKTENLFKKNSSTQDNKAMDYK